MTSKEKLVIRVEEKIKRETVGEKRIYTKKLLFSCFRPATAV